MKLNLRWRIFLAYTALTLATCLGLHYFLGGHIGASMIDAHRKHLHALCAVIAASLDNRPASDYAPVLRDLAPRANARIAVFSPSGELLVDSTGKTGTIGASPEVSQARREGRGSAIRPDAETGIEVLHVAQAASPDGPCVRLSMPLDGVRRELSGVRRVVVLAAVVALIIAGFVAASVSRVITHPLDLLAQTAWRLAAGDLSARVRISPGDETREAAQAMNEMAERLQQTREDLQRSAAHLSSVLAQMADGIIVVGPDESVQVFNHAAADLLDADEQDAVGRPLAEVVLHYELHDMVRRSLRLRARINGEIRSGADAQRHIAVVASVVEAETGELIGAVASLRDISQIRRLQKIRQDFVANAGHELRTPVAAIRSLAETLAAGAIGDPEAAPGFLTQIVDNTARLGNLIEDMMTLAQLEATERSRTPEEVDVRRLVEEASSRFGPQAEQKGIEVTVDAPGELRVCADREMILAAVVNLVDNAVKYTPAGGRVSVRAEEAGEGAVAMSVSDTGPGIPAADRERIFERFYRVDRGRSAQLGGTGLGLSIVRHAVESNGGRVRVESIPQGGARFVITLPKPPGACPE